MVHRHKLNRIPPSTECITDTSSIIIIIIIITIISIIIYLIIFNRHYNYCQKLNCMHKLPWLQHYAALKAFTFVVFTYSLYSDFHHYTRIIIQIFILFVNEWFLALYLIPESWSNLRKPSVAGCFSEPVSPFLMAHLLVGLLGKIVNIKLPTVWEGDTNFNNYYLQLTDT